MVHVVIGPLWVWSVISQADRAYHDTYYVVSWRGPIGLIAALFALPAIIWLQERRGALRYPKAARAMFWVLHGAVVVAAIVTLVFSMFLRTPILILERPQLLELGNMAVALAGYVAVSAFVGLFVLSLSSLLREWRG